MKIVFTLTKKDIWCYYWQKWLPRTARLILRLCALPALFSFASYWGGLGLLFSAIVAAVIGIVPFAAFLLRVIDLFRVMAALQADEIGERIAEIGKFDFRCAALTSSGYFYHWAYLEKVRDDGGFLCFTLPRGRVLLIPKSAFKTLSDAEKFLALALSRWETAKANQRYAMSITEGVWPPPPRDGSKLLP